MLVAGEGGVHGVVDAIDVAGVEADEVGGDFSYAGADAEGVRGNEVGAEGGALAPSFDAGVGRDTYEGSIKAGVCAAAGEVVCAAGIG